MNRNLKYIVLLIILSASSHFGFGQTAQAIQTKCYYDTIYPDNTVFLKSEISPEYKYGQEAFLNFLIRNNNLTNIVINQPKKSFVDTIQVSFIVSKDSKMNNLTITKSKNESTREQLIKAFQESGCDWTPGNFSGRSVTSWVILNIYHTVQRDKKEISPKISYELINKWSR